MSNELEQTVKQNTADIHTLVVNVTRLSTIVENAEKRHDTDFDTIKEAVAGINKLNERVAATLNLEKDIGAVRELFLELKGDVRAIRHDTNSTLTGIQAVGVLSEKMNDMSSAIAAQGAKIEALESWRDKADGAATAIGYAARMLWAIGGAGVLALGYFLLQAFFTHHTNVNISGY